MIIFLSHRQKALKALNDRMKTIADQTARTNSKDESYFDTEEQPST